MANARRNLSSRLLLVMGALTWSALSINVAGAAGSEPLAEAAEAEACLSCHGANGSQLTPILEGQDAAYLQTQIARFRDHVRDSFPMGALAQGLDDDAIRRLSQNLSSRPWPALPTSSTPRPAVSAADRTDLSGCVDCHGQSLRGQPGVPRLAGQRTAYLIQQLEAIADDRRQHPGEFGKTPRWRDATLRALASQIQQQ